MYNVIFEYSKKTGAYFGNRFWTHFKSKQEFNTWYTEEFRQKQIIIEEGVTKERCLQLVRETPIVCRISAIIQESCDFKTGRLDFEILRINILSLYLLKSNH